MGAVRERKKRFAFHVSSFSTDARFTRIPERSFEFRVSSFEKFRFSERHHWFYRDTRNKKRETHGCPRTQNRQELLETRNSKLETRNSKLVSFEKLETRNEKRLYERKREFRRIEQALKAADLLLQSGGFGLIVIDLADVPPRLASRIPLTSWFRFRRAVENTPAVLLVLEQEPFAKSCASLVLKLENRSAPAAGTAQKQIGEWQSASQSPPAHTTLLTGIKVSAEVIHDRTERKPVRSATANFESKAAWAG